MAEEKARKAQQEVEVIKDAWKQSEEVTKRSRQELQHARLKADLAEEIVARTKFDALFPEEELQSETCHEAPPRGEPIQHVYPRAIRRASRSGSRTSLRSDTGRAPQVESSGDSQRFQGWQRASSPPPTMSRSNSQSSLGSASGLAFDQVYRKAMAEMKRNQIAQTKDAGKRSTGRSSRPSSRLKSASRSNSVDKAYAAAPVRCQAEMGA